MGANQILKVCQSQRDCVPKPRVARNELPWGNGGKTKPQRGFGFGERAPRVATPLGLFFCAPLTQGSSFLATLGFVTESRWDSKKRHFFQPTDLRTAWAPGKPQWQRFQFPAVPALARSASRSACSCFTLSGWVAARLFVSPMSVARS